MFPVCVRSSSESPEHHVAACTFFLNIFYSVLNLSALSCLLIFLGRVLRVSGSSRCLSLGVALYLLVPRKLHFKDATSSKKDSGGFWREGRGQSKSGETPHLGEKKMQASNKWALLVSL